MNLEYILASSVDATTKGMPALSNPIPLGAVGKQGWNILREDLPLPLAVLKVCALAHNSRWMRTFLRETGVSLAPHGKTTMSPQLFARQLDDGAWGITCATVEQLQVYRRFGVNRVMFANELVGRQPISYVLDEIERDQTFEFYAIVDTVEGAELLAGAARERRAARPLRLLIEVGLMGGRTGARRLEDVAAIATAIAAASPWLALSGISSYEGIVSGSDAEMEGLVSRIFDLHEAAAKLCAARGYFAADAPVIFSAGGSQFPDMAAARLRAIDIGRTHEVVIRSGCYLTHDAVPYAKAFARLAERAPHLAEAEGGLVPALELWAYVQSRPEPGLAFATLGKRDTGIDMGLPVPQAWYRPASGSPPQALDPAHRTLRLNNQHAYLEVPPDSPLRAGDMITFGIAHPCTTFDKWVVIPIIDGSYDVVDAIRTYF